MVELFQPKGLNETYGGIPKSVKNMISHGIKEEFSWESVMTTKNFLFVLCFQNYESKSNLKKYENVLNVSFELIVLLYE